MIKTVLLRWVLLLMFLMFLPIGLLAKTFLSEKDYTLNQISLEISQKKEAKLFYSQMLLSPSVCGKFSFFQRKLDGQRRSIFERPSYGKNYDQFSVISEKEYSFSGSDLLTKAEYRIIYKQKHKNELLVSLEITVPEDASNLSFEILTLSPDFFIGNVIEGNPKRPSDSDVISMNHLPLKDRFLLKRKNLIRFHGKQFDVEIEDLDQSKSINLADFRQVRWARYKGLYCYSDKLFLKPGENYVFNYSIRVISRDVAPLSENRKVNSNIKIPKYDSNFFYIPAKEETKSSGNYVFNNSEIIVGNPQGTAEIILKNELQNKKLNVAIKPVDSIVSSQYKTIHIETEIGNKKTNLLPAEGFEILVTDTSIKILGADERGSIYGVRALLSRIRIKENTYYLPCGSLKDWPDVTYRGACLSSDFIPTGTKDIEFFKRYLDAISMARGNVVIFYHQPNEVALWLSGNKDNRYWSQEEMIQITEYARFLKLEVWAGMTAKFKRDRFSEMEIIEGSNLYNPMEESSYEKLFSLYKKVINLYKPSHFLIGHDEIKGLNKYATLNNVSSAEIFAKDIHKINNWLSSQDIQTVMAGDMLLDAEKFGNAFEPANSQNKMLNSGATHLSIDNLPNDIMIFDWHYSEKPDYKSIQYFSNKGFKVIGVSYHSPIAGHSMARSVKNYKGQGIFVTNFGFWRTFSPASTTLYTLLCGWSSEYVFPDPNDNDIMAFSALLRPNHQKKWNGQYPLSLICNNTTWDVSPGDDHGFLDFGPIMDLRKMPLQKIIFNGINFSLQDSFEGLVDNCIILNNEKKDQDNFTAVDLQSNDNTLYDAFAFLHTSFVDEPSYNLKEIGGYTIEYLDGKTADLKIISGWNITDIRTSAGTRKNNWPFSRLPDVLIGSELVWRGVTYSGIPINLQSFIAKNPYPKKQIKRIKIKLKKQSSNFRLVLLGVTGLNE